MALTDAGPRHRDAGHPPARVHWDLDESVQLKSLAWATAWLVANMPVALAQGARRFRKPTCPGLRHLPTSRQRRVARLLPKACLQVAIASNSGSATATEIVRFDPQRAEGRRCRRGKPVEHLRDIKAGHEPASCSAKRTRRRPASIGFRARSRSRRTSLVFTPTRELVAQGPERGAFTLVDSRPLRLPGRHDPRRREPALPGVRQVLDRLPKDTGQAADLLCQGVTCMMSPSSLRRGERWAIPRCGCTARLARVDGKNVGNLSPASSRRPGSTRASLTC